MQICLTCEAVYNKKNATHRLGSMRKHRRADNRKVQDYDARGESRAGVPGVRGPNGLFTSYSFCTFDANSQHHRKVYLMFEAILTKNMSAANCLSSKQKHRVRRSTQGPSHAGHTTGRGGQGIFSPGGQGIFSPGHHPSRGFTSCGLCAHDAAPQHHHQNGLLITKG